jgi:transcriptional regulator with XRE-family HTH domain
MMNMHDICDFLLMPQPDTRVILDGERLIALRRERSLSREAVSELSLEQRKCLSVASISRAESGKPVLYLTARYLAEFYNLPLQTLLPTTPVPAGAAAPDNEAGIERLQTGAALEGVLLNGRGRLIEACGGASSGKSRLLEQCLLDARLRGFAAIALHLDTHADGAAHPLRTFMLRLLRLDTSADSADALEAAIRARCHLLDIQEPYSRSLLSLLEGGQSWPRPAVQRAQATALCVLIQRLAQQEPLVLALDDLHHADWALAMTLEMIVPPTLMFPVLWFVTSELSASAPPYGVGARLDGVPRTVYHLTRSASPRSEEPGQAKFHRIGAAPHS